MTWVKLVLRPKKASFKNPSLISIKFVSWKKILKFYPRYDIFLLGGRSGQGKQQRTLYIKKNKISSITFLYLSIWWDFSKVIQIFLLKYLYCKIKISRNKCIFWMLQTRRTFLLILILITRIENPSNTYINLTLIVLKWLYSFRKQIQIGAIQSRKYHKIINI